MRVGPHHDRRAHGRTVENHLTVMPNNSRRADQAIRFRNDTFAFARVMIQQAKAMAELTQMLWTRIGHRNPSATAEYTCGLAEVSGGEDTDDEINGGILHRPIRPEIRDSKCKPRPPSRGVPRCVLGNIEAQ